jgi:hypothetical protein
MSFLRTQRIRNSRIRRGNCERQVYLTGVFPIRIETQDGLIEQLVSIKMFVSGRYLHIYRDRISSHHKRDSASSPKHVARIAPRSAVSLVRRHEIRAQI